MQFFNKIKQNDSKMNSQMTFGYGADGPLLDLRHILISKLVLKICTT